MNQKKIVNPDNSIYKCKTEEINPKDFRNYQNLIDSFKYIRDGNIIP